MGIDLEAPSERIPEYFTLIKSKCQQKKHYSQKNSGLLPCGRKKNFSVNNVFFTRRVELGLLPYGRKKNFSVNNVFLRGGWNLVYFPTVVKRIFCKKYRFYLGK